MTTTSILQPISLTLPPDLLESLDQVSLRLNVSRVELMRQALERFLLEQQRSRWMEMLAEAYQEYSGSSKALAEEFFTAEQEAWDQQAPWKAG